MARRRVGAWCGGVGSTPAQFASAARGKRGQQRACPAGGSCSAYHRRSESQPLSIAATAARRHPGGSVVVHGGPACEAVRQAAGSDGRCAVCCAGSAKRSLRRLVVTATNARPCVNGGAAKVARPPPPPACHNTPTRPPGRRVLGVVAVCGGGERVVVW